MADISRTALFGKLNDMSSEALRAASGFCLQRGNPFVEMAHWIHQLYTMQNTDLHHVFAAFEVNEGRFAEDLVRSLDALPRGASSVSGFSPAVDMAVKNAWVWSTLQFEDHRVRSGHLILGILKDPALGQVLSGISREFVRIDADVLARDFLTIVGRSPENVLTAPDPVMTGPAGQSGERGSKALDQFTVDWTVMAASGEMDPVVGRDDEIRQIIDILMRRRQNNPILTGEAGVGKTAVVEGFAQRIARGDVPPALQNASLRYLDVGLMQAGASMRGEFEKRLRQVVDEVQASDRLIILFIDEAHTLIGAGGAQGTGDAANLLKPALARGALRTIAATTWSEYKKYIEKDPALTRRFQVIQVDEPDESRAIRMLRGLVPVMESHHGVIVLNEAIESAARLSHRYIPSRQLPDKGVSLLDTACARVGVSQHAVPAEVDDTRKRIDALELEREIVGREEKLGVDLGERRTRVEAELAEAKSRLQALEERWAQEKAIVDEILAIHERILKAPAESVHAPPDDSVALASLRSRLAELQGDQPLMLPQVDSQAVASVVADWTGIPVGRMVRNEAEMVLNLADILGRRVIGQRHAHEVIVKRLQTARAGLDNPDKPVGVFMLAGPSGVGKTETALALAEAMYGGEQNLITINMSEFQEAHTVSTLKGAPPGYVGYGEGGVLTEAVRRKPYSVVLLDEVEKAHPDVHEIFFQVFDKGQMEDGEGREIDFRNTLIILTTNVGTDLIMSMCADAELIPDAEAMAKALRKPLLEVFPPALLGRIVTIPFYPLNDEMIRAITRLQLDRIASRVAMARDVKLTYSPEVVDLIAARCTELESGGRMIDNILTNSVLPTMSEELLRRSLQGETVHAVEVSAGDGEFLYQFR